MHCSQIVKKYNKHFQECHLPPLGNYDINQLILKNPTKGSCVFETPNYFGESNCECIRRTLTSLYPNEIILKSIHINTVLEGSIDFS